MKKKIDELLQKIRPKKKSVDDSLSDDSTGVGISSSLDNQDPIDSNEINLTDKEDPQTSLTLEHDIENDTVTRRLKHSVKKVLEDTNQYSLKLKKRIFKSEVDAQGAFEKKVLHWIQAIKNLLEPEFRPRIHTTFLVILMVIGSYSFGRILGLMLKGTSSNVSLQNLSISATRKPIGVNQFDEIAKGNLFHTESDAKTEAEEVGGPQIDVNVLCREGTKKTSLPVTLLDTTVLKNSAKSVATLNVRGKSEPLRVREGERVDPMLIVGKIDRLKTVFRNLKTSECEYIVSQAKGKEKSRNFGILSPEVGQKVMKKIDGIDRAGNKFKISRSLINKKMENLDEILQQASSTMIRNPDGSLMFKIMDIEPGSIFSFLGIEDGDKISHINGEKIKSQTDVLKLFNAMKNINQLQLTVMRNNEAQVLDYNFGE